MERCPLCRAALNGAQTCRRCKAELGLAQRAEAESRELAGAAMYRLARGESEDGLRLLRFAMDLHATPEVRALWRLATSPPTLLLMEGNGAEESGAERLADELSS